ncbi:HAUS augmin-like complex subunit 3 [Limulus polyphemus]|uniref:HAUS augmin-like complex subunit 3 n=1 Tax=Limulus polyphemus TaxID=6850 RepID=A0ABM1SID3_LIMPO|nr:HAUS augmin-like complex subunit 3 [Limulus polyphemus]
MSGVTNGGGKFLQTLAKVGFPGTKDLDGSSFDWMFEAKPLIPFLDWFCDSVDTANVLTQEELQQFEELKSCGSVLKGEVLEKALQCLTFESQSVPLDVLREEVSLLRAELSSVEARVNELTHQRDVLSIQLSQDNHRGLLMEDLIRDLQHDLCKQQEQFVSVSKEVSSSIHSTVDPLEGLTRFYTQETKRWKEPDSCNHSSVPGSFFTSLDLNSYHETEEHFLDQLRSYIKKQFCQVR